MTLLAQLNTEVDALVSAGESCLASLSESTDSVLSQLRLLEAQLVAQQQAPQQHADPPAAPGAETARPEPRPAAGEQSAPADFAATIDRLSSEWYSPAIAAIKTYNTSLSRFMKHVGSSKFHVSLDDAYAFPLQLEPFPAKDPKVAPDGPDNTDVARASQAHNRRHLLKSIVLHLLKSGHGSLVLEMLPEFELHEDIDPGLLQRFAELSAVVDDIKTKHDLDTALAWLAAKSAHAPAKYDRLQFKFHMLQFVLLLAGKPGSQATYTPESALAAYQYAKGSFPPFVKDYIHEISPVITLLLFRSGPESDTQLLRAMIRQTFSHGCRNTPETQFVAEILASFDSIHSHTQLFCNLANEFLAEFCADLQLSSESSLFQAVLAGFVNLSNFHRYSGVQQRFRKSVSDDLPFQLPDRNQFLFSFHPIFICPVSKEQLMPLVATVRVSDDEVRDRKRKSLFVAPNEILQPPQNPVVVFEHCRHLALKDSVRHLTKGGAEVFKCHYCYKKHKLSEVSDAYFIDL